MVAVYTPAGVRKLGTLMSSQFGRMLAYIGYYSYTIYLWHVMLAAMPMHKLLHFSTNPLFWLILTAVYVVLAVGVGVAGSKLVDTPMLAMRDRLYPARAKALNAIENAT